MVLVDTKGWQLQRDGLYSIHFTSTNYWFVIYNGNQVGRGYAPNGDGLKQGAIFVEMHKLDPDVESPLLWGQASIDNPDPPLDQIRQLSEADIPTKKQLSLFETDT